MALPKKEKSDPRPVSTSFRISERASKALKTLASEHNLSQADVVEYLILEEFAAYERKRKRKA